MKNFRFKTPNSLSNSVVLSEAPYITDFDVIFYIFREPSHVKYEFKQLPMSILLCDRSRRVFNPFKYAFYDRFTLECDMSLFCRSPGFNTPLCY